MGRSQAADSRADTCDVGDDGECGGLVHRLHHGLSGAVSVALPLLREKAVPVASGGKRSFCCVPERHHDGLRQAVLSGEFPPVAVFAGDVVCVLEYGTVEESMAVVLDWSRRGVVAGFFRRPP